MRLYPEVLNEIVDEVHEKIVTTNNKALLTGSPAISPVDAVVEVIQKYAPEKINLETLTDTTSVLVYKDGRPHYVSNTSIHRRLVSRYRPKYGTAPMF